MANIRQGIRNALAIPRDVVGGTADYIRENNAAHAQALKTVGAKQNAMIDAIHRNAGNAPTPMGTNEFYGRASAEAKRIKKEKGISLVGSIKKRLKNPND
jgi:hypothetical protein